MSQPDSPSEAPWAAGLRGARANLVPGIVLQVLALALVISYYQSVRVQEILTHLTELRATWGLWFPILSTGLCGGVLPMLVLWSSAKTRRHYTPAQGLALTLFWAFKGVEIALWYQFLEAWIGPGHDVKTVAIKMFLDQFVWCPLWAISSTAVVYAWITHHFDFAPVWADLRRPGWYLRSVVPVLISNLGVWVPTVCIIYSLPTPLQLPLQNVILVFFTLIVAHVTAKK